MNETVKKTEYSIFSAFLMRCLFTGPVVYSVLHIARQDGWISMLLSLVLSFIPLFIYYLLLNHDSKLNIVGLSHKYLGILGKIITLLLSLFVFFQASMVLWNMINFISSQYLYQTPLVVISILFMVAILYLSSRGLSAMGRSGIVMFIISIMLFFLSFFSLFTKISIKEVFPIFEFGAIPIIHASGVSLSYNVLPLFVLLIIPKDNIEDNKKMVRSFLKIYLFIFITLFLVVFTVTAIFGIKLASLYQYPEFHILKTINIGNFFQRVETVLSVQWIFDSIMAISLYMYFIKTSIVQTFKLKIKDIWILFTISILLIILTSNVFPNNTIAENFYMNILPILNGIFFGLIPLLILIVAKLRKNKV